MLAIKRLVRGFYRLLLPTVVLLVFAFVGASIWLVHKASEPPKASYMMTPERYGLLSTRAAKITDEKWANRDGTQARGWLLRGKEGAPAVILMHRYGADRSWVLNLGVKLNEATDFTVLMPDLRGHGENPSNKRTSFSGAETEDTFAAIDYLKSLKSENNNTLVSQEIGLYGVELGALAAISVAAKDVNVKALVADSVPFNSNDLLQSAISKRYPFVSFLTAKFAQGGTYLYYFNGYNGEYSRDSMCEIAKMVSNRRVLLLASTETADLQDSTSQIASCFPNQAKIEKKLDLMPSGYNINNATIEQSGTYDLRVIDFFRNSLLTFSE
ncbi:MAG: alpha/beta fold hydrolase [Acidobacteriota bacterium]